MVFAHWNLAKLLTGEDKDLIGRMKSILGPFILRRLKYDVMQQLHQLVLQKLQRLTRTAFLRFFLGGRSPTILFSFVRKLSPMGAFDFECTLDKVIGELKNYSDFSIHRLLLYYGVFDKKGLLPDKYALLSSKSQALAELFPSLKLVGHRVLISSQWTSMLDILEWTLDVIGVTYRRLDGSTQVTERQTVVDRFNNATSIFACFLSTRAGGQGLNFVGADTVVIHDMDFNPQIDRQAEDRCAK